MSEQGMVSVYASKVKGEHAVRGLGRPGFRSLQRCHPESTPHRKKPSAFPSYNWRSSGFLQSSRERHLHQVPSKGDEPMAKVASAVWQMAPTMLTYGLAALCVVAAWLVAELLQQLMNGPPWFLFLAAVMISSWVGGWHRDCWQGCCPPWPSIISLYCHSIAYPSK